MIREIEVLNFAAESDFEVRTIKSTNGANPAFPSANIIPELRDLMSQSTDDPNPSDDDASGHELCFPSRFDVVNRVSDRPQTLIVFVGNGDSELFLELHPEFDQVE